MSEEKLIAALENLTDKIEEMSGKVGRGTKSKTSQIPGGNLKNKTPEEKALAAKTENLAKIAAAGIDIQKKSNKANKEQIDSVEELTKAQKSAKDEQQKLERSLERAKTGFKDFGQSLFKEKTNFADAVGSLGSTLSKSYGIAGRSFGGIATGVGYAIGAMQNFAESAKDMGTFADLGAFQVGSVRQARVLSGLGDSFIKVIEQSNGTFKALGSTSQDAVENLSNLSRGLRYGSSYLNSAMKKSLGTDLVKSVDKAARATAAMGLSTEDQANLEGSILASTMLNAKNEDDAKQKFVKAMSESVTSARGLSDAFGMSAKTVLAAMAEFRKTQAGTVAGLEGNEGAKNLYAVLKKFPSLSSDPAKLANIAMAMSEGNLAKAQYNVEGGESNQLLQQLFQASQGTGGGANIEQFNKNIEKQRGEIDLMYESRKSMQGFNDKYAQSAVEAKAFLRERDIATGKIAPDKAAKEEKTGKSEADNIQTMNSLTAALESLRGVMIGLTAGVLALLGPVAAIALSGGIGGSLAAKGLKGTLISLAKLPFTIAMASAEFYKAAGGFKGMWESTKGFSKELWSATKTMYESAIGFGKSTWEATKAMYANAGGITGMLNSVKNFGMTLWQAGAKAVSSLWTMAVTAIQTVVPALVAMARAAWSSMLGGFGNLGKVLGPVAGWFSKIGPVLGTVGGVLLNWGSKLLPILGGALRVLTGPIGWLITGATLLYSYWDEIVDVSKAVWNGFTDLVSWLADGAGAIWDTITAPFTALSNWLSNSWLAKTVGFGSSANTEPTKQTAQSTTDKIKQLNQTTESGQIVGKIASAEFASIAAPASVASDLGKTTANTDASSTRDGVDALARKASDVLTPETISQLMGYLSSMQNDLAAIRGNTKLDSYAAPVRLS